MRDLPPPETDDPRERDHGELFRASPRQLPVMPPRPGHRKLLWSLVATAAAVAVTVIAIVR